MPTLTFIYMLCPCIGMQCRFIPSPVMPLRNKENWQRKLLSSSLSFKFTATILYVNLRGVCYQSYSCFPPSSLWDDPWHQQTATTNLLCAKKITHRSEQSKKPWVMNINESQTRNSFPVAELAELARFLLFNIFTRPQTLDAQYNHVRPGAGAWGFLGRDWALSITGPAIRLMFLGPVHT